MQNEITLLVATRTLVLKTIEGLSLEDLNNIPENYNNNIAWNVAHILVTQQLLHYGLSDLPFKIKDTWIDSYRKGTAPHEDISAAEWTAILEAFQELPKTLDEDYRSGIFTSFNEFPTSYGYTLHNIDEAIMFNNAHEALHLGYIMSLKRAL